MEYDFYCGGILSFQDDVNIAKRNSVFSNEETRIPYSYDFSSDQLPGLLDFLSTNEFQLNGDPFSDMMRLTFFLSRYLNFGETDYAGPIQSLLYLPKNKSGINANCKIAASVLTDLFLACGYKARLVRCLPLDIRFNECHCVTVAFVSQYNKYVVFDAAMGGVFFDFQGVPLSLRELRDAILTGEKITIRNIYHISSDSFIRYFAKNMVRFQTWETSRYGAEDVPEDATMISLHPLTVPLTDKVLTANGHRIQWKVIYNEDAFFAF